jgi:hypothetical protein
MAIGAILGGEIHIHDVNTLLYPLISREVIERAISQTRITFK